MDLQERLKSLESNLNTTLDSQKSLSSRIEKHKTLILAEEKIIADLEKEKSYIDLRVKEIKDEIELVTNTMLEKKFDEISNTSLYNILSKFCPVTNVKNLSYYISETKEMKGASLSGIHVKYVNDKVRIDTVRKSFINVLEAILYEYSSLNDFIDDNIRAKERGDIHFICSTESNCYFDSEIKATPSNNIIQYKINGDYIWFKQITTSPKMFFKRVANVLPAELISILDNKLKIEMEVTK